MISRLAIIPMSSCSALWQRNAAKIVCEVDEHEPSAIADLIGAGLGVGLVPAFARRGSTRVTAAWVAVDSPDCRRTVTLHWAAGSHLSTAARLMRTTITDWDWIAGEPQEERMPADR